MAGATPFLQQLLAAAERADTRLPGPEGVHLRRRIGVAVADPQRRRRISTAQSSPGCTAPRKCPSRPSARQEIPTTPRTPTAGPASPTSSWSRTTPRRPGPARSVPAALRCCSATYIPKTRPTPSTPTGYFRTGDLGAAGWMTTTSSSPVGPRTSSSATGRTSPQGGRGRPRRPPRHRRDRDRRRSRRRAPGSEHAR